MKKPKFPHTFVDGVEYKRCHACGENKPLKAFTKDRMKWDGLYMYCKVCKNEKKHVWNMAHIDEQTAYFQAYHLANKTKKNAQAQAWYLNHRESMLAYAKQYALEHPEKREWTQRWVETHQEQRRQTWRRADKKRRMLLRGLPYIWRAADEAFAFQYWHYACAICGAERGLSLEIALDHWIPVHSPACPGTIVGNMVPICHAIKGASGLTPACNQKKGKKDPLAWLPEHLGVRQAKKKLQEIALYFEAAKVFATTQEVA